MEHIKIIQNNTLADTEEVSQEIIQKLYDLAVSGDLDASSEMKGRLHLTAGYRAQMEYLHQMFPNLIISADTYIIPFEDPKMVTYLNSIGVGSNGVITENDAASATVVANSQNTEVTIFNELKYFTSIIGSKNGWEGVNSGVIRFYNWTALEEVDISNFTSLGHSANWAWEDTFYNCSNLKKVVASSKLLHIGYNAFSNCVKLEDIIGLDGNIELSDYAFKNCQKLKDSTFENCVISFYGTRGSRAFGQCETLTSITLHPNVTTIPEECFWGCTSLANVNLNNITCFKSKAFLECRNLQGTVPQNIILDGGHRTFENCVNLQFPSQITVSSVNSNNRIGRACFYNTTIQEVTIDSSIEILNSWCFMNCSSLKKINGLTNIKYLVQGVFSGCTNLEGEIDLSNVVGVYLAERWDNAAQDDYLTASFKDCQKITSVKLGHIEGFMSRRQDQGDVKSPFYNCSMLHTVDVNSMDTIMMTSEHPERGAFFTAGIGFECPSMRNFILRCTTVPTIIEGGDTSDINMNWFGGSQVTIYVPDSALNDYKTAWAAIASNIKGISEYVPIV